MANQTTEPHIRALSGLLDREKTALLSGDLGVLTKLTIEKEELLSNVGALAGSQPDHLAELKAKVERNQVLLNSALEGIREVSDRIKMLRKAQRSLETYDRLGQRSSVSTEVGSKVEKRA